MAEAKKQYAEFSYSFDDPWAGETIELVCRFAKPSKTQVVRLQDTAGKSTAQASRNLLLGIVHPEDKQKLLDSAEEYPGCMTSFSTAIIKGIGITADLGN